MTELEKIKEEYPNVCYAESCFFENHEEWINDNPLTVTPSSFIVIDANAVINDHFEGRDVLINPDERNPENQVYAPISGREYVKQEYAGNYFKAFSSIKF